MDPPYFEIHIRYQIFITTRKTQSHEHRQVKLARNRHNNHKCDTNHPELCACHVHLRRISQQLYSCDETENKGNNIAIRACLCKNTIPSNESLIPCSQTQSSRESTHRRASQKKIVTSGRFFRKISIEHPDSTGYNEHAGQNSVVFPVEQLSGRNAGRC